jgi:hypothetical protein
MNFDKDKLLKLLQKKEKEGEFLKDFDQFKNKELMEYFILVEDQIFWESQKEYFHLLDLFVKKKISLDKFFYKFSDVRMLNLNFSKMWQENFKKEVCGILTQLNQIDFQLNPESETFGEIISSIHSLLDLCDRNLTLEMDLKNPELNAYGISEESFRLIMEKDFLPLLKNYFIFHLQH